MKDVTYILMVDENVDGCGTNVETILEVGSKNITSGTMDRVKSAIDTYKENYEDEWDTDGCLNAAAEQFEKEGYTVRYIVPTHEIWF
jgi:hypothetical protein